MNSNSLLLRAAIQAVNETDANPNANRNLTPALYRTVFSSYFMRAVRGQGIIDAWTSIKTDDSSRMVLTSKSFNDAFITNLGDQTEFFRKLKSVGYTEITFADDAGLSRSFSLDNY